VFCRSSFYPVTYISSSGKRVTTETAYLTPDVLKRPNLKVAVHAQVTRILFDTTGGSKKAVGVEFSREKGGPLYRVRAKQQVILAYEHFRPAFLYANLDSL
jgi:choline dehydrogenase-like flavoprotein